MTTQVNSTVLGTLGNLTVTNDVRIGGNTLINNGGYKTVAVGGASGGGFLQFLTNGSAGPYIYNTSQNLVLWTDGGDPKIVLNNAATKSIEITSANVDIVSGNARVSGNLTVTGTLTTSGVANGPGMNSVNYLSANVAVTSASLVDVAGLLVTTEANKFYRFEATILHNVSTNCTRGFAVKYTTGHTAYFTVETNATSVNGPVTADGTNANAVALTSSASDPAGRSFLISRITGSINGSTAGHVQIMAQISTGTLTLLQGSQIVMTKLN